MEKMEIYRFEKVYFAWTIAGLRSTSTTESPRKNIFEMTRSLLTGFTFFLPLPVRGISVHISVTFSRTMLQWRSNALTRPRSFLLLRQLMRTWVLFLTDLKESSVWWAKCADCNDIDLLCEHTERPGVEFLLFQFLQLFGCHFRFWFGGWKGIKMEI